MKAKTGLFRGKREATDFSADPKMPEDSRLCVGGRESLVFKVEFDSGAQPFISVDIPCPASLAAVARIGFSPPPKKNALNV